MLVDVMPVESLMLRQFDYQVNDYQQQCLAEQKIALSQQVQGWKTFITDNQDIIEQVQEWQVPYIQIKAALDSQEQQPIANNNGTIAQVVASLNHFKEAVSRCHTAHNK